MVTVYIDGKPVPWADAEQLIEEAAATRTVEFRNGSGRVFATAVPEPDWVAAITPEETARRLAEPGFTFEEVKKRLGWE
ncbi:MAG: hypothetical protein C0501_29550 [Isosphaera sp.]|nr:hypothetical protein [Isosphaera sp.]